MPHHYHGPERYGPDKRSRLRSLMVMPDATAASPIDERDQIRAIKAPLWLKRLQHGYHNVDRFLGGVLPGGPEAWPY